MSAYEACWMEAQHLLVEHYRRLLAEAPEDLVTLHEEAGVE